MTYSIQGRKKIDIDLTSARTEATEIKMPSGEHITGDHILVKSIPTDVATCYLYLDEPTEPIDLNDINEVNTVFHRLYLLNSASASGGKLKLQIGGDASFKAKAWDKIKEILAPVGIKDASDVRINPAKEDGNLATIKDGVTSFTASGLARSTGDSGASPENATGKTMLAWLSYIYNYGFSYLVVAGFSVLTTTPLGGSATYTSSTFDLRSFSLRTIVASAFADQVGTLYIDFSPDGTNWDTSESTSVSASTGTSLLVIKKNGYLRIRYVNGASAQGVFRLSKIYALA